MIASQTNFSAVIEEFDRAYLSMQTKAMQKMAVDEVVEMRGAGITKETSIQDI
jgi:hypothetical protein